MSNDLLNMVRAREIMAEAPPSVLGALDRKYFFRGKFLSPKADGPLDEILKLAALLRFNGGTDAQQSAGDMIGRAAKNADDIEKFRLIGHPSFGSDILGKSTRIPSELGTFGGPILPKDFDDLNRRFPGLLSNNTTFNVAKHGGYDGLMGQIEKFMRERRDARTGGSVLRVGDDLPDFDHIQPGLLYQNARSPQEYTNTDQRFERHREVGRGRPLSGEIAELRNLKRAGQLYDEGSRVPRKGTGRWAKMGSNSDFLRELQEAESWERRLEREGLPRTLPLLDEGSPMRTGVNFDPSKDISSSRQVTPYQPDNMIGQDYDEYVVPEEEEPDWKKEQKKRRRNETTRERFARLKSEHEKAEEKLFKEGFKTRESRLFRTADGEPKRLGTHRTARDIRFDRIAALHDGGRSRAAMRALERSEDILTNDQGWKLLRLLRRVL